MTASCTAAATAYRCLRGLVQTIACVSPTLGSHHHSALTAFQRDVSAAEALGAASAALQKPVSELKIMVVDDTVFSGLMSITIAGFTGLGL